MSELWLLLLLVPVGVLVFVRWLTRRTTEQNQLQMTDARRAEIIRLEQEDRG